MRFAIALSPLAASSCSDHRSGLHSPSLFRVALQSKMTFLIVSLAQLWVEFLNMSETPRSPKSWLVGIAWQSGAGQAVSEKVRPLIPPGVAALVVWCPQAKIWVTCTAAAFWDWLVIAMLLRLK